MEIKIKRLETNGKWACTVDDRLVSEQTSLMKLFKALWKWAKGQEV